MPRKYRKHGDKLGDDDNSCEKYLVWINNQKKVIETYITFAKEIRWFNDERNVIGTWK